MYIVELAEHNDIRPPGWRWIFSLRKFMKAGLPPRRVANVPGPLNARAMQEVVAKRVVEAARHGTTGVEQIAAEVTNFLAASG